LAASSSAPSRPRQPGCRRTPFLYQIVDEEARPLLLRRFPYAVFYEIYGSEVVVIACLHEAQDPGIWHQRLSRR